ncbi:MAG: TIGR02302 family protein [Alsobacter sp.]
MSEDGPGARPRTTTERAEIAAERIASLGRRAGLALFWERIWPPLALLVAVVALFLTVSWLGLWLHVPYWARAVGVAVTGLALAAALILVLRAPFPSWRERLARLDRDSDVPHRPATALTDELASPGSDPGTRALWELHRARVLEQAAKLKVSPPRPQLARLDPRALRFGAALCAIAAWFIAGPEREARLAAAFDWTGRAEQEAAFRLDAWIDPPAYTQFPPVIVDFRTRAADAAPIRVPVRSTLVLRASDATDISVTTQGGLAPEEEPKSDGKGAKAEPGKTVATKVAATAKPRDPKAAAGTGLENRYTLKGDGSLVVKRGATVLGSVAVTTIPDKPPTIQPTVEPTTNEKGVLTLGYEITDDYGVVSAEAKLGKPVRAGKPVETKRPPLVPAPEITLQLPGGDNRSGEARTSADLTAHPWAGARVEMTLVARDEPGQVGESVSFQVTLPQRPFSKPLARALVEQRRDLILDPASRNRIQASLQALMIAPERFTPDSSVYLGLRSASTRLRVARTDQDLIGVADLLWEMALQIEDGDMTDAEKALRQAQDNLRDALDKNASEDEIRRLTQELRQALDQFLKEFAERQLKEQQPNQQSQLDRNTRVLTPQDLKNMLDRMEEMARNGNKQDAQRMLEQLRNLLDNLRTARNGQRQMNQGQREMEQQLDALDKMTREQQQLRDKTFREGQKRREQARRGDQGQQQQAQRGQRGQKGQRGQQGQQGQPGGDQPGDDQEMGQGDEGQEGMEGLGEQQESLRKQLEQMKKRMRELGMNGEQGLEDAEEAMRQAEGALGKGDDGSAVDAQGRALEGLRKGAQGMAQQMQQGEGNQQAGENPGQPGQPGQPGRRATASQPNDDPLGRPTPTTEAGDRAKFRRGGKNGTLEERAREVTEELRRRLGDPARPQDERDYLERLLPAN